MDMDKNYHCPDCYDSKLQSDKNARKINEIIEQVNELTQLYNDTEDFIKEKGDVFVEDIAEIKVDEALDNINAKLDNINTTLNEKQNKTDNTLNTSSKEITVAINEVNSNINQANSRIDEANNNIDELTGDINELTGDINEINGLINRNKYHYDNGYETLPSGLILQWGENKIEMFEEITDTTEVYFPLPFPNNAFTVLITPNSNSVTNTSSYIIQCYDIGNNCFTARATHCNYVSSTGRVSFSWFAIGN